MMYDTLWIYEYAYVKKKKNQTDYFQIFFRYNYII